MGPKPETCHNLGFIFMFLLVALLRMAHAFLFPSTLYTESNVSKVVSAVRKSYHALEAMMIFIAETHARAEKNIESAFAVFFQFFDEFVFSFIPFALSYIGLWLWGRSWGIFLTWIYWINMPSYSSVSAIDQSLKPFEIRAARYFTRNVNSRPYMNDGDVQHGFAIVVMR